MDKYKTETNGNQITIWNETEGVGLQFTEGEPLQRYTASIVLRDTTSLSTEEGVKEITEIQAALTRYAEEQYPKEFAPVAD